MSDDGFELWSLMALFDVLYAFGVKFSAAVGHSSGELAAAYTSGLFSAADCVRIAYFRGRFATLARNPKRATATG
ncbi:hypothetical protein LY78DRAFT_679651 [Colletotrichum sublineola]|nr:hypothetical protein LY78DRAFT_679651 [Colletotrichum sublineola]